jgi:polysaccharide biosynthesis/export protein
MIRRLTCTSMRRLLVLAVLCPAAGLAGAQEKPVAPAAQSQAEKAAVAVSVEIAPGDLLEISVFDVPELTQQVRVGADGKVQLALLGSTPVAGLTGQEAAEMIARQLREGNFLLRPQVNVLLKEFASQGVSVIGEVKNPGVYQVLGLRSLLDVISMAGGLTTVADTRITVKRRTGRKENVTVKLKNDDVQTSLANDVQIHPGDLILVPRAGIVYVLGDVNRPGGFVMQDNGAISLLQALAQAGGVSATGAAGRAVLLRKDVDGYASNKLHLGKIARGEDPDVELHANDVVFVPNSRLKNVINSTQGLAASIASASVYAIVR